MRLHLPKINLDVISRIETVAIDTVAAISPWLAPVIPAYLTNTHMAGALGYPTWVAFIGALVVECLGLAAIYTATQFWDYNDAKATEKENRLVGMSQKARMLARKKRQRNAPFKWAALAMGFYIVVILTVNAALEMEVTQTGFTVKVFSNALLSLLSVIAGLIIALRSQHRRRLEKFARVREAAGRLAFSPRKTTQEPVEETQKSAEVTQPAQIARRPISRTEFLRLAGAQTYAEVAEIAQAHDLNGNYGDWLASRRSVAELAKMVDLSPRTAQYWTSKPKEQA
ncbi:hypothetical protein TFLX_03427 [Thermoflexales bacterium]|nr:hypothetical protein TFLX_03427 [Thermoflexales bacterium]